MIIFSSVNHESSDIFSENKSSSKNISSSNIKSSSSFLMLSLISISNLSLLNFIITSIGVVPPNSVSISYIPLCISVLDLK